ncbi:MAG: hydroxyacylglutathione hydrolase [Sedimentisphaerales bacterium]|nr:hydroxyacylglutathione hydrolase [Sedimentisphaerales bacterium]
MDGVITLRAMGDNYIYLVLYAEKKTLIIDPGISDPVIRFCEQRDVIPTHILLTHHHSDHTGGVAELTKRHDTKVIEPNPENDRRQLTIDGLIVLTIATPGHTRDSVSYLISSPENTNNLFTGDTLFIAGCGRMLETDMNTMYDSLQKLAALVDETLVYPGHDYTEEDYRFALTVEPDNPYVKEALNTIRQLQCRTPHVPSTIQKEKRTNPFLRAADVETFTQLRLRKDNFLWRKT